jgi:hypothetical protein
MKCCIAALYLPLLYKLGSITSKFMYSIFDIRYWIFQPPSRELSDGHVAKILKPLVI